MPDGDLSKIATELASIKRLLVLALTEGIREKIPQDVVAKALGIGQASVSRMVNGKDKGQASSKRRG
jgi:predicted transcriptional regulator